MVQLKAFFSAGLRWCETPFNCIHGLLALHSLQYNQGKKTKKVRFCELRRELSKIISIQTIFWVVFATLIKADLRRGRAYQRSSRWPFSTFESAKAACIPHCTLKSGKHFVLLTTQHYNIKKRH